MLARLVYVSEAAEDLGSDGIEVLLRQARRANKMRDISGMLAFDSKAFLQVVEGDAQALSDLYGRLVHDPRHRRLKLLEFIEVSQRQFDHWTMGFAALHADNQQLFLRHTTSHRFEPYALNAASALAILTALTPPASSTADPAGAPARPGGV